MGFEIDKKTAEIAPSLRDPFGIIVVACSNTGCVGSSTAGLTIGTASSGGAE